ncbi:hypothetical protein GA0115254_106550 [Streptomyces sp. Ncost-T10-10d]|nr:hypothetical protein GA0115254_106550 [Streptomyces sp. Ncost-T10-10d]
MGREDELADLGRLLDESRLVTVVGAGGVGKTRCATKIAALMEKRYCDGVWMVELSALHDPGLLDHALVDPLGLTDHTGRPPHTALFEHLAGHQLLLVIDGRLRASGPLPGPGKTRRPAASRTSGRGGPERW